MLHWIFCFVFVILTLAVTDAHAIRTSKSLAVDHRIHVMEYNPDDVHRFTGYYGYQSSIEFAPGESISTISMGDTISWQIVPAGNRMFLKPMEEDATTNMTVLTNKRIYHFELHAEEVGEEGINHQGLAFIVRFVYPDTSTHNFVQHFSSSTGPDLTEPENYNFNYTLTGSEMIAPIKVFDDEEFTYFEFRDKNAEIPAFFLVEPDGSESIINYRVNDDYIVVERVASQFTLRRGDDVICIFNESKPLPVLVKKN